MIATANLTEFMMVHLQRSIMYKSIPEVMSCGLQFRPTMSCSDQYGDGSGTSSYYVSDQIHLQTIVGNSIPSNASASIVFSCSTSQTSDLTRSDRTVDGIFGFGQQGLSVIAQLSSQGLAPDAFSHCLVGNGDGGGILVRGQIIEPNIVYTPHVTSPNL